MRNNSQLDPKNILKTKKICQRIAAVFSIGKILVVVVILQLPKQRAWIV